MFWTLRAVTDLGGRAAVDPIVMRVIRDLHISAAQMEVHYPTGARATGSKVRHRLAFARTGLKNIKMLSNPERSVWEITKHGAAFLKPLTNDPHALPRSNRSANSRSGVEMTALERELSERLIAENRTDSSRRYRSPLGSEGDNRGSVEPPTDWPSKVIESKTKRGQR